MGNKDMNTVYVQVRCLSTVGRLALKGSKAMAVGSNVGRFMIIEKPQKFFFPTFVSDYNNPEPNGEQRYESQPEQGSYRGAVP